MNSDDSSPKKGKSSKTEPPSTPSEPDAPAASKSLAPWELTAQMTEEQIDSFADELVKLFLETEARKANPPAK
jgi:hypothetical protein